ncbi:MAG: DUF2065 domain-containing protein [Pseudomonadota bacterium]
MTGKALTVIGIVLAFEGLIFALAPGRLENALRLLAEMPLEARRLLGLATLAVGVLLLWGGRMLS